MGNTQGALVAADRRVVADGQLIDDEHGKIAVLVCRNARIAIAYSGLAHAGSYSTHPFMLEALGDSAEPDFLIGPLMARFADRMSARLRRVPATAAEKRLSFIFGGYLYDEDPPRLYLGLISNFERDNAFRSEAQDEFVLSVGRERRPPVEGFEPAAIRIAGNQATLEMETDLQPLMRMLEERRPMNAIADRTVATIRGASESAKAQGAIGKQCMSVVLDPDPRVVPASNYYPEHASATTYLPSQVEARGGEFGVYMMMHPEVRADGESAPPMVVPKTGRNKPCPCGSGKKYKKCHGA